MEEQTLIPKVKNDEGETITSRKGVANVFGEFCSKFFMLKINSQKCKTHTTREQERTPKERAVSMT